MTTIDTKFKPSELVKSEICEDSISASNGCTHEIFESENGTYEFMLVGEFFDHQHDVLSSRGFRLLSPSLVRDITANNPDSHFEKLSIRASEIIYRNEEGIVKGYFLSESRFFPLPSGHFNIAIEKTNVTRGTEHIVNRNTLDAILSDAILKNEVAVVNFSSLEKSKKLAPNSDIYGCVTIPTSDYVKEMENDADINALITAGCGVGKTLVDTMVIAQTRLGKMRSFVLLPSYVTSFAKEGEGVVRFSSVGYRGGEFFSASFDEARGRAYAFGMRKTSSKE